MGQYIAMLQCRYVALLQSYRVTGLQGCTLEMTQVSRAPPIEILSKNNWTAGTTVGYKSRHLDLARWCWWIWFYWVIALFRHLQHIKLYLTLHLEQKSPHVWGQRRATSFCSPLIDGLSRPSGTQRRSSRIGNRENNPPMEENPRTTHSESPSFWGLFNASMLMMMKEKRRKAAVQRVTYLKMHIIKIYEQVLNTDTTHQPLFDLPQRGGQMQYNQIKYL